MTHTQENTLAHMNRNELTGLLVSYANELSLAELRSLVGTCADVHIANEKPERKPSTRKSAKSATKSAGKGKRTPKVYEVDGKQKALKKGAYDDSKYHSDCETIAKSRKKADAALKELCYQRKDGKWGCKQPALIYERNGWLEEVTK